MARVIERPRTDGTSAWAVTFRYGKKQTSRTFEGSDAASRFAGWIDQFGVERALRYLTEEETFATAGISVDELAQMWLTSKQGQVTKNILVGYRRDYATWIKPKLGHREAAMVDEVDVQNWVDWMRTVPSKATGKPLSPKSIVDRHSILHQMFAWGSARTRDLVPRNPCKETDLPKRKKTTPKGLRLPELHALLAAGESIDHDAADLIAFMASTGWRISEAIALTAGAVEDDGVHVYVTMERVLRRRMGIVEGGKSSAAMRRLRVLGVGVPVLRRRMVGLGPGDPVFTFADGRPGVNRVKPWNVNAFRDIRWPRIVKAAGLTDRHPTPHWLRHTHVAVCHAAGLSLAEIQRRLGHEDIQTTINIYGRMIEDMSEESADRLDALLTPQAPAIVAGSVVSETAGHSSHTSLATPRSADV